MQPIILVVPPYAEHSNGIKSLHKICHTLNQIGADARLAFLHGGIRCGGKDWTNPALNTPCLRDEDKHLFLSSIVIYPEIVTGNPACATKIVRYLGNKDGLLTGQKMNAKPTDFLLAHSKIMEPNAHCILFNAEFNPVFHNRNTAYAKDREMDATYIGKGFIHGRGFAYGDCPVVPDKLLIERMWPRGAEQLAYLLRRTRFFYTYDPMSATNVDAILCGAVPFFMRYDPWTEEEIDGSELGPLPRLDNKDMVTVFDVDEFRLFLNGRDKLVNNINLLNASWEERVKDFHEQVQAYFGEAI